MVFPATKRIFDRLMAEGEARSEKSEEQIAENKKQKTKNPLFLPSFVIIN